MSHRASPWQELCSGAVWPLIPLGLIAGILLGNYYPNFAMKHWLDLLVLGGIFLLTRPLLHWRFYSWVVLLACLMIGMGRLGLNFDNNHTQILSHRYFGSIEGRVIDIDQSHSQKIRLTLDDVYLAARPLNGLARISLHGEYDESKVRAGVRLQTSGHLSPPNGPAEPGGYNFRKRAWLDGIAAVGYSRNIAFFSEPEKTGLSEWILNQRRNQSKILREKLGQRYGGFVAAIYVGDRSELEADLVENMRNTNLAHLLAISGMHMGTVCGLMFFMFRRFFGYFPLTRNSGRPLQMAVLLALLATSVYFTFSGMAYSATRAYMMSILFFSAMAFARRSFSIRSIAAVATLILLVDPNAIYDIGFQLSFSATIMLVVAFEMFPVYYINMNSTLKWFFILFFTSFIAGLATMPLSAFHFNQIPKYGLIANVLAVPIMSFWVMPSLIAWSVLRVFDLGDLPLFAAKIGVQKIDQISIWVANFNAPIWRVGAASEWGISLILIAGLVFALARWRGLTLACLLIAIGLYAWPKTQRPYLLVADTARFFAVQQDRQRWFSSDKGHSFLAEIWSQGDGQIYDQEKYALPIENDWAELRLKSGWRLIFTTTKKGAKRTDKYCYPKTIIIAAQGQAPQNAECVFYNEDDLFEAGGLAIDIEDDEIHTTPFFQGKDNPWMGIKASDKSE